MDFIDVTGACLHLFLPSKRPSLPYLILKRYNRQVPSLLGTLHQSPHFLLNFLFFHFPSQLGQWHRGGGASEIEPSFSLTQNNF